MVDWKVIGERLRLLRESAGWSIEQVADYMGWHISFLKQLEQGEIRHIGVTKLDKLCTLYAVEVTDLCDDAEFDTTYRGAGKREKNKK